MVICTRDRADSLDRTLRSIRLAAERAEAPGGAEAGGQWELLVVDNGSTDHTPATVARHDAVLPVRRVSEPVAGLSNARNAGVAAARGRFILWTDDDVMVHEDWLASWFRAFRAHPDMAIFGGRTRPVYEEPRQEWFVANEEALASLLAIRDEPSWEEITPRRVPFGLNYAVRAQEQRTHLYDPQLGVAPGRRQGGEETTMARAILASGGTGRWVWDALVYHVIPPERQTIEYVERYYLAFGYQFPRLGERDHPVTRATGSIRMLARAGLSALRYGAAKRRDKAASVPHLIALAQERASLRRYLGLRAP